MIQHRADKGHLCSWAVFEAQAGLRLTHDNGYSFRDMLFLVVMVDRFIVTMDATLQYSSITVYAYVEEGRVRIGVVFFKSFVLVVRQRG